MGSADIETEILTIQDVFFSWVNVTSFLLVLFFSCAGLHLQSSIFCLSCINVAVLCLSVNIIEVVIKLFK